MMKECVNNGWYIAIGGVVTFKNAHLIDIVKDLGLDVNAGHGINYVNVKKLNLN